MDKVEYLLPKVKANLIIPHDEDNDIITDCILAAIDYAEGYQHVVYGEDEKLPPATVQGIVMLASHFYESRDGSTAGFFADYAGAAGQVWNACNRLFSMNKRWSV
jgi:hypothetical protein